MPAECGTTGGYQKHRRDGTKTCKACRAAQTAYNQQWSASSPTYKRNNRLMSRARSRALAKLAEQHPDEYRRLYQQTVTELRTA
ncbi:hypothetical protein ATK74_0831 [Propionicimonas paludicola]|uniref:Uncharacterized protein n=1 Tax=Propionicimonas paludicola TaxID=185243 RepID=A0A2A9CPB1_9ACTN|nr:hypothetical protein ATK74_0831 [Propionicimonas paludicola]